MAGYVGNVPVPQSVREDQSFTATAGQTTFNTLGYTDGNRIKVTLNGVLLEGGGVDYTATNGSDVVLTVAAAADDILRFETFNEVQLVGNTSTSPIFKTSATLKNDTEEDTDGGRESTLIFSGEQSGGEISTLAEIEASHDGTADDEKGDLIFRTNDGNDGTSPTERLRINSAGDMLFSSDDPSLTIANTTHEDTDGGRESTIVFQGEQSGGEVSTLAQIEAAHDGTADDEKGDLIFRTNDGNDGTSPTEAMRITSAQKIGIGTSDPLGEVTIAKDAGGNAPTSVTAANTYLQLGSDDFGPSNNGKFMIGFGYTDATNTNSPAYIGFEETSNSGDTKGALTFYTRDVVTDTAPTERMRILPAGGIAFNGDTSADNALDDYEEGTFTAAVKGNTTNPTTATNISGTYTKIGNFVSLHMTLSAGNLSGASGYIYFEHMPFAAAHTALGNIMHYNVITYSLSGHTDVSARLGGTVVTVYGSGSNQNWGVANHNGSTNAYIDISINYRTS